MSNFEKLSAIRLLHPPPTEVPQDVDWRPKCYVAGPMTGIPYFNEGAFLGAAMKLRRAHWMVTTPIEQDKRRGEETKADGIPDYPMSHYMKHDLPIVCESDAIFLLPGWEESKGALLEFAVACELGVPCYEYETGAKIIVMGQDAEETWLTRDFSHLNGNGNGYRSPNQQIQDEIEKSIREQQDEAANLTSAEVDTLIEKLHAERPGLKQHVEESEREAFLFGITEQSERHPNSARFHELLGEAGALHDRKQKDYGAGDDPFKNVRNSSDWGVDAWVGAMIRLNDKIKRLQSLIENGRLANESALDSFRDITVYSVIAQVLFEEQYGRDDA